MDYLIPANTKKSQLIFNMFRPIDLGILCIGAITTLILMFIFEGDSVGELIFKLAPIMITGLLVMPIAFYHNGLVFLQEVYLYFTRQSRYLWRGWCAWYDGNEEQKES